jgi:amino acid transporter
VTDVRWTSWNRPARAPSCTHVHDDHNLNGVFMHRRYAALSFATLTLLAAPAYACPPSSEALVPIVTAFLSVPYALVASFVLALFARSWSLGFWGWLRTSVASYGAAAVGACIGALIVVAFDFEMGTDTEAMVLLTSPLVSSVAYLAWVRSRRFLRADRRAAEVIGGDEGDAMPTA